MRKIVGFLAVVCVYVSIASASDHPKRMVTPAKRKLLSLHLLRRAEATATAWGGAIRRSELFPLHVFSVTWAGAPNQSVVVGNYAVDPYTGDVWSAVSAATRRATGISVHFSPECVPPLTVAF